jgi:carboxypeptidase C (cathepsin A)
MSEESKEHTPPKGTTSAHSLLTQAGELAYAAEADFMIMRDRDKPVAEIFYVHYHLADTDSRRPITFVFNGGPGAASAYLHMGAVGPRRVRFRSDGTPEAPPVTIVDNEESWLMFSDLVFVDPVGTGFSRAIDDKKEGEKEPENKDKQFWKVQKDLDTLGQFISRFLGSHHRWDSPVFLAGESYGGYRAAKLARLAQEKYGVGLNGAVLISPALEFALLDASDYDVLPWTDLLPSIAAAAAHHGKSGYKDAGLEEVLDAAEEFATGTLPPLLMRGDSIEEKQHSRILRAMSKLTGLKESVLRTSGGRIGAQKFVRELLRDEGLVCGLYDATVTAADPFPDRNNYEGADPTLRSIERVFAAGVNTHIRRNLGVEITRDYHLLSMEVNQGWQIDMERHALESQIGATDDLRYGMSLNPDLRVRITHGFYDLMTPYYSSNRIASLMRLPASLKSNLSLKHYPGGHMFYAWEESRQAFTADIREFYRDALGD